MIRNLNQMTFQSFGSVLSDRAQADKNNELVVPLSVMDKNSRLGPALREIEHHFDDMELLARIAFPEGRIAPEQAEAEQQERKAARELIRRADHAGFLPDPDLEPIQALGERIYLDREGTSRPWLTEQELTALSIRKGTLTAEERAIMESHVVFTSKILDQVSFPKVYDQVPEWAGAHHELLNGKGYPRHLTARDIPREVRLLTVLDIFDALTARDRPYKPGIPAEKALSILHSMADEGSLDADIVDLFEKSKAWEGLL